MYRFKCGQNVGTDSNRFVASARTSESFSKLVRQCRHTWTIQQFVLWLVDTPPTQLDARESRQLQHVNYQSPVVASCDQWSPLCPMADAHEMGWGGGGEK